jgi:hypothetical protein
MIRPANVANHVVPHRGDWELFSRGELESVCFSHHNQDIQREETHGFSDRIGADGYPVDPRHPFNSQKAIGKPVQADRDVRATPPHALCAAPADADGKPGASHTKRVT